VIFQHTWQKVLDGSKTQTRRLAKPGDQMISNHVGSYNFKEVRSINNRCLWFVGEDYAVQPGRGQKSVGRFLLTDLRFEDVRAISEADAWAEGGYDIQSYLCLWASMHDKALGACYDQERDAYAFRRSVNSHDYDYKGSNWLRAILEYYNRRPTERYQAWVLTFEVVK
jgi:hypothetical protein